MPQSWNTSEESVRPPERHRSVRSAVIQGTVLLGLWLLFSGHYDVFHISAGVLSVGLIMLLNRELFRVRLFPGDIHRELKITAAFRYVPWLLKEIIIAAIGVARIVLTPRMPLDPSLLEFHAELPNAGSQTILANSITLTPGTITIDISHGVFLVHAINDSSSDGLVQGVMPARVAHLYRVEESGEVTDVTITKWAED
jgi:multicomponent Na+:H+ antiporter subunit E